MVDQITLPLRISREFAQAHRDLIFLYGNDYFEKGIFGQAWSLGGTNPKEENCFRIPTLYKYCANPVFWTNSVDNCFDYINSAFEVIPRDGRIVIPLRRIGQGGSRCMELAPNVYEHIMKRINEIAYPNIVWR